MGVHGLTSFIEGVHKADKESYREKIVVRGGPVVVDGNNLMYFLYFDGKTPVVSKGQNKAAGDLAAKVPQAHLYGGDWIQYAQNVRYFFQQLKHCNITAIVIFDGAYDSQKIEVAHQRFAKTVKENVTNYRNSDNMEEPGRTYTPIFLKSVFLEVLSEQKIPHYQANGEADPTIALIAKLLKKCPILSSDSDFYIYADATPIKLQSLNFSLKQPKADIFETEVGTSKPQATGKSTKVWTLEGEYVSLAKICKKKFGLTNMEMMPLAALIIGNDTIAERLFKELKQGDTLQKRIESVFKWLARQKSVTVAFRNLVSCVPTEKRQLVTGALRYNLELYKGENGETFIWELIKEDVDVSAWTDTELDNKIFRRESKLHEQQNRTPGEENLMLRLGTEGKIKCTIKEPTKENSLGIDEDTANITEDRDGMLRADVLTRKVPEWYRNKHVTCEFQTYLLNIVRNQIVFLPPQVERYGKMSSHDFSVPIIRVTAGILLGDPEQVLTLESQNEGRVLRHKVAPLVKLETYGPLPLLKNHCAPSTADPKNGGDFSKCLSHENRLSLLLTALRICEKNLSDKFLEGWPAAYRIWIATLMYFIRQYFNVNAVVEIPQENISMVTSTSIFLCIIKNLIVNPGKIADVPNNRLLKAIAKFVEAISADPEKLKKIREFYQRFEEGTDATLRKKNPRLVYFVSIPNALCQYLCIVFHTDMLNNLLGNPLKPPKVRYTMNNFFVYNFARHFYYEIFRAHKLKGAADFPHIVKKITGVREMKEIYSCFLDHCMHMNQRVDM